MWLTANIMQDLAVTNEHPAPPAGFIYGSFSARTLALSIDQIILFFIIVVLTIPVCILLGLASFLVWPFFFVMFMPATLPATSIIAWLYFASQESSKHQATFGKRLCGLRVTDMLGNRISFPRATVRFFGKFLSSAIMLIGFLMAAFTERHQALHDLIAETLVLKKVK